MNIYRHQISPDLFFRLAAGGGGSAAIRQLAAVDYSKRLLLLRGIVSLSRESGHPRYSLARRAFDLLGTVQDRAPEAVDTILRYPSVGAWASRTVHALDAGRGISGTGPEGMASLAAAAAIRCRFPCDIEVPIVRGVITVPSLGRVHIPALRHRPGVKAVLESGAAEAAVAVGSRCVVIPNHPYANAPGWQGLRQIRAEARGKAICLLIDDVDPYRISAPALASRLSEDEVRLWEAGLTGAWETLTRFHDTIAEEVISAVRVLTPLVPHADGQISATSRETFGCVGLSLAAEPLPLAASLAHEIQHAKLFALIDAVKLTYPDDGSRYYAPWRDDARPISGLLQGAYAYLGVAGFWRRQRQIEKGNNAIMAHAEFGRWRAAVQAVTRTLLNSGRLTPAGERFVARMAGVIGRWCGEPVPAVAMEAAHAAAQRHKEHWRRASGRGA